MRPRRRLPQQPPIDAKTRREIDARYGLEPVFEPSARGESDNERDGTPFQSVQCPFCGEQFETLLDLSAGSARYIEDCQICCRPIEMSLEVEDEEPPRLNVQRGD